jgi:Mrp family chromosome partitioning ATPase
LNIAVAAAQDGRHTLLIDADARVSGLTRLARFDRKPGLTDLPGNTFPSALVHDWLLAEETTVRFVPAGTNLQGDTAGYFRSLAFRDGLPKLIGDHDLVIIDTPPVMSAAETIDIAAQADGAILVILPGTRLRHLTEARDRLALSGTPILGYIFNRAKVKEGYGYRYPYGYKDGYGYDSGMRG